MAFLDAAPLPPIHGVDPERSYGPGETPFGDASAVSVEKPAKSAVPQQPSNFLSDIDKGDALQHSLVGPAKEAQSQQTLADRQRDDDTKKDRERMDRAWGNEYARADDPALEHWDADKEKARRTRGPMEQFGSIGMIFAMAASAFTRTPMTSALNAGAAAMTAIQQGDEKAYESAYKAWKDNSDLAIRRFDMEHRLYEDANKLVDTDMNLWKQKTLEIATQFDDKKTIAMLEMGMEPKILEAQASLSRSRLELVKAKEGMEEIKWRGDMIKDGIQALRKANPSWKDDNKGPEQAAAEAQVYARAVRASKGFESREPTGIQEFTNRWWAEHPNGTAEEFSTAFGEFMRGQRSPAGGAGVRTEGRERTADVEQEIKEMQARGELKTPKEVADYRARRTGELKTAAAGITGNEKVKLQDKINQLTHFEEISNRVLKELTAHPGSAGLAGGALRIEERLSNMVSAGAIKDSDRVQMMRDVTLLRVWAAELLTSRNNKLRSAGESMNDIVGGLSRGDTTANTTASLKRLNELFRQIKVETQQELGGGAAPAAPAPTPSDSKPPWATDPIVK